MSEFVICAAGAPLRLRLRRALARLAEHAALWLADLVSRSCCDRQPRAFDWFTWRLGCRLGVLARNLRWGFPGRPNPRRG